MTAPLPTAERYEIEAPAGTACGCGTPATTRVLVRVNPADPERRLTLRYDRCAACLSRDFPQERRAAA